MKNILILGANGFIGTYLSNHLKNNGYNIITYDRTSICDTTFHHIIGNFSSEQNFEQILIANNVDTIYHLISTTVPSESTYEIDLEITNNVIPTIRLLEAMKNTGVQNLIFASSGGTVYKDDATKPHNIHDLLEPICSYGVQKVVIEEYMLFYNKKYNLNCKIARISNPYGFLCQPNRIQGIIPIFLQSLINNTEITLFGQTIRDYIYIDDLCEALILFGEYTGEHQILNIGSGIGTGLHELVSLMETVTGKKFQKINEKSIRSCDVKCNILDIQETKNALFWEPITSLSDGLLQVWNLLNTPR